MSSSFLELVDLLGSEMNRDQGSKVRTKKMCQILKNDRQTTANMVTICFAVVLVVLTSKNSEELKASIMTFLHYKIIRKMSLLYNRKQCVNIFVYEYELLAFFFEGLFI